MTQNNSVLDQVLDAKALSDLDGSGEPRRIFRQFASKVHPDLFDTDALKEKAEQAFIHLTNLKNEANRVEPEPSRTIKTKKREYTVENKPLVVDGMLSMYKAEYDAGYELAWFNMMNPQDTDLMENYISKIKKLTEVNEKYRLFYPQLLESFRYRDPSNTERLVAVTSRDDHFVPLSRVKEEYPAGISGRNVAWIFRRMLVALGNAHELGLVHGAPTVDSFWIDAGRHGLILDNWGYAVDNGESLTAVPPQHRALYPEYALTKGAVSSKLDMSLAAKTAASLLSENEPAQLRAFFKGCQLFTVPPAAELLGEFDKLLLRLYGKPRFSELQLKGN